MKKNNYKKNTCILKHEEKYIHVPKKALRLIPLTGLSLLIVYFYVSIMYTSIEYMGSVGFNWFFVGAFIGLILLGVGSFFGIMAIYIFGMDDNGE